MENGTRFVGGVADGRLIALPDRALMFPVYVPDAGREDKYVPIRFAARDRDPITIMILDGMKELDLIRKLVDGYVPDVSDKKKKHNVWVPGGFWITMNEGLARIRLDEMRYQCLHCWETRVPGTDVEDSWESGKHEFVTLDVAVRDAFPRWDEFGLPFATAALICMETGLVLSTDPMDDLVLICTGCGLVWWKKDVLDDPTDKTDGLCPVCRAGCRYQTSLDPTEFPKP